MTVVLLRPAPLEVPGATYIVGSQLDPTTVGGCWSAAVVRAAGLKRAVRHSAYPPPVDVLPVMLSHAPARQLNSPGLGRGLVSPVAFRGRALLGLFFTQIREVYLFPYAPSWQLDQSDWGPSTWRVVLGKPK